MQWSSETLALLSLRLKLARCCSVLHVSRLAALWTACLRRSMLFPIRKQTLHAPREPFPSVKLCIAHHSATISESAKTAASRRCATRALPRQPRAIMSGIVTSLPGASVQNFHADASPMHFALAARVPRYRLFQVFFPLVDIPKDSIGTQFWAGSHLSRREREFWRWQGVSSLLEADASAKASMSSPACPVGSIIIFDYRIIHRGLGNHGLIARPIGHALLSTGLASDRQSYGRFPSVWDTAAIRRGGTPPSSDFAAPAGSRAFL